MRIKWMMCAYRNRERIRDAITFRLARLDLYPGPASALATS